MNLPENAPETYEKLCEILMPRKIYDAVGQEKMTEIVDWLSIRAQTPDQIEYLDLVSNLLDKYESQFIEIDDADPLEVLQYLVKENGITGRKLGEILDVDHSTASRILKGDRGITVEHAKNLGNRFKLDPAAFLKLS